MCFHFFSRTVAAMEMKRGYVGKYHDRCSVVTETVTWSAVSNIPSGKHFLGVCVRGRNSYC